MPTVIPIENAALLNKELTALAKEVPAEAVVKLQKKVTFDLLAGVIKRTPVDEGQARGGWQVGVNAVPELKKINRNDKNEDPRTTQAYIEGIQQLAKLKPYSIVFVSNNVNHVIVLDQGLFTPPNPGPSKDKRDDRLGKVLVQDGYSIQAPLGMVDLTIEELRGSL